MIVFQCDNVLDDDFETKCIEPMIKISKKCPRHVGSVPPPRGKFPRHVAFQMSAPASWHTSGGVTLAEYHGAGELH